MNLYKLRVFFTLLCMTLSLSSCASIINGKNQTISFTSYPDGAAVVVNGEHVGETPLDIDLARNQDHEIVVEKSGYHTQTISLKKKVSPVVLLYVLPGGLASFCIDAREGCQYTLGPDDVVVTLERIDRKNPLFWLYTL